MAVCVAGLAGLAVALTACSTDSHRAAPRTTTTVRPVALRPHRSPGCSTHRPFTAGITQHTIRSGGRSRVYELDVPKNYDATRPYAIVFGLHALTVDYRFIPSMTGFADADRYQFIGVSPSGLVTNGTPYWDAAPTTQNYDVQFLTDLLRSVEAQLCVDPSRVFSTGMSNGAQMSALLACRLSDRITAIAPVSGVEFPQPCAGAPVPIMAFHGSADPILPYKGGGLNATHIADLYYYRSRTPPRWPKPLGVDESMRRWARHNGCDATPVEQRVAPHVLRRTWSHCKAPTVLYVVEGGGHSWPGQPMPAFEPMFGPGTTEINATDLMFHFFFADRTR